MDKNKKKRVEISQSDVESFMSVTGMYLHRPIYEKLELFQNSFG